MTAAATNAPDDLRDEPTGMEVDPGLKDAASAPNIVSLRSAINPPEGQRVPAFAINGTVYTIATRPKTNAGLKYIHLARTKGQEIAVDFMLETLLGTEGYQALMDFDDLTEDDLTAVITRPARSCSERSRAQKGSSPQARAGRLGNRPPGRHRVGPVGVPPDPGRGRDGGGGIHGARLPSPGVLRGDGGGSDAAGPGLRRGLPAGSGRSSQQQYERTSAQANNARTADTAPAATPEALAGLNAQLGGGWFSVRKVKAGESPDGGDG